MFSIFEMPNELKDGFNRLILQSIRKGLNCYIGSIDDEPVGICGLFSSVKVGEIYAVGTLKDYRGGGIGTTVHCKLYNLGHQSEVLPGNGTGWTL